MSIPTNGGSPRDSSLDELIRALHRPSKEQLRAAFHAAFERRAAELAPEPMTAEQMKSTAEQVVAQLELRYPEAAIEMPEPAPFRLAVAEPAHVEIAVPLPFGCFERGPPAPMLATLITGPAGSGRGRLALDIAGRGSVVVIDGRRKTRAAAFKQRSFGAPAVVVKHAESMTERAIIDISGGVLPDGRALVITADLEGLAQEHWLRRLAACPQVRHIELQRQGTALVVIRQDRGALLSPCQTYRYELWRVWNDKLPVVNFVLLNPSTADAIRDDPTVSRCCRRARLRGFGGVRITNLYALRSSDPGLLRSHVDPVGPDCDAHLQRVAAACQLVVCGWGTHGADGRPGRVEQALRILRQVAPLHALKLTADGHPGHPLYLPYSLEPQLWLPALPSNGAADASHS